MRTVVGVHAVLINGPGSLSRARVAEARDDRFVAAVDVRGKNRFTLAYVVRAVTPGTYAAPGVVVEDMYRPGRFRAHRQSKHLHRAGSVRQRAFIRRLIAGVAAIIAIVAVVDVSLPPTIERAGDVSPLALDRNGEWLHAFSNSQGRWRFGADLNEIDPVFIERLIAIEDSRFYQHPGVDLLAVMRAGASAVRSGQIVSGASTITMQTARLLEPRPRNLGSKIVEMLRALQLERRLSKREILELYLTLAPYGGNLEGVRAASLSYFGKEPTRLNDAEQALLIALPQAPEARRPDLKSDYAKAARARILTKLVRINAINSLHANEASDAPVPEARRPLPRLAYHAATAQTDNAPIVRTTLDAQLQAQAESLVTRHAEQFDDGATASLLIIENETRAVLASVGSSGFDAPGGWIDLTAANPFARVDP